MYAVCYRFTLQPKALTMGRRMAEAAFVDLWTAMSEFFRAECGALDSRLHRGADGAFYGYAQWPSAERFNASREVVPTEEFVRLRLKWAELCAPSEILFQGPVEIDLPAA
jgi:hypothetical protein